MGCIEPANPSTADAVPLPLQRGRLDGRSMIAPTNDMERMMCDGN